MNFGHRFNSIKTKIVNKNCIRIVKTTLNVLEPA